MSDAEKDPWRTLQQKLPLGIYDRLIIQMSRVGRVNGISIRDFLADDKNKEMIGPRVCAWECLVILMENSGDDSLRNT